MHLIRNTLVAAALVTTALSTAVYAAEQPSAKQKTADQDFSKLSKDGFKAMQNVREARLAIFNGMPDQARKDLTASAKALDSAKTDETSFMKAEADLKTPAEFNNAPTPNAPAAAQTNDNTAAAKTTPVAWLPINGSISIAEDFSGTPAKVAGVKKANEQLKSGQRKEALETLKMSDVNVAVAIEAAPLNATVSGVDQASKLIDGGKYYEANIALKNIEDGIRFYVVDASGAPVKNNVANAQTGKTTGTAPADQKPATPPPAPASK